MEHPTAHALTWFEIPVRDLNRASAFYETLLATTLRRETLGGSELAVFGADEHGVGGCLMAGDTAPAPSTSGTLVYLNAGARRWTPCWAGSRSRAGASARRRCNCRAPWVASRTSPTPKATASVCTLRHEGADVSACWLAVASAEHVAIGRRDGFMQVGHGKGAPLKRLHAGDRIAYDSPVRALGARQACQAFTAIGTVRDERVYHGEQGDMGGGFLPFRKDVDWLAAHEAPIRPLLDALSFTAARSNWGHALRFGLLKVTAADMDLIAQAMHAS